MTKPKKQPIWASWKKLLRYRAALIIGGSIILAAIVALYVLAYQNKVYPRIYLGGEKLSGLTADQVKAKIEARSQAVEQGETQVIYKDKNTKLSYGDLDLKYDRDKIFDQTFGLGRDQSFLVSFFEIIRAPFWPTRVKPIHSVDEGKIAQWGQGVAKVFNTPHSDTNLEVKAGKAKVIEPKTGEAVDQDRLKRDLAQRIGDLSLENITAVLVTDEPKITIEQAEQLKSKAIELTSKPLVIKVDRGGKTFTVKPDTLGGWIELKTKDHSKEAYVSFNSDKIIEYLDDVAAAVNIEPTDAKFTFSNGQITVTAPGKEGYELNREKAAGQIVALLEKPDSREITLALDVKQPAITAQTLENVAKLGIRELVGKGTTSFAGSPQNRRQNIATGAKALNGILLKPGEEFSTVKKLGSIDSSQGYLPELVIKENKTIPEFGGGLCQVSTTLFRAILNSGLKVTDRTNHLYRVSYYEPPVGMDATIYSPKPDLKFINNTDNYLLIQSSVSGNNLTFEIYGTKDDRQITITEPVVYDVVAPGNPVEVPDPTLEPGTRKQTEGAHPGAKAYFDYKVVRGGKVLQEIRFKSNYVPWTARFLVGPPKEEEKPAEEPKPEEQKPAENPPPA